MGPTAWMHRRHALLLGLPLGWPGVARAAAVPLFVGDGSPVGPARRMLAWVSAQAALTWDIHPTPWLRAQRLTAAGQGVMFGLGRTPERERLLRFSLPVWVNHTWAVVREGEQHHVQRYADLKSEWVCWARGSSYGELFEQAGLGRMRGVESNDDDSAMRMAAAGRCRAALVTFESDQPERTAAHPALQSLKERGLALVPTPMTPSPLHFACGLQSPWGWVIDRLDPVLGRSRTELDRLRQ
ncbi:MAG: transporter substrate-binding domain-containing protein [Burkholderiales bacterium]|nr:MAG: transporter substrate-binding domain-containing protein [Burkholderiales bacterium]